MKKLLGISLLTLASLSFSKAIPNAFQIINNTKLKIEQTNQQQKAHANDITSLVNYGFFEYYDRSTREESSTYNVLNWKKFANTWQEFINKYPKFNVLGVLIAGFKGWYPIEIDTLGLRLTSSLKREWLKSVAFEVFNKQSTLMTLITLYIWYDNDNIYWKWSARLRGNIANFMGVQIDSFVFTATLN